MLGSHDGDQGILNILIFVLISKAMGREDFSSREENGLEENLLANIRASLELWLSDLLGGKDTMRALNFTAICTNERDAPAKYHNREEMTAPATAKEEGLRQTFWPILVVDTLVTNIGGSSCHWRALEA